jgi:hypothetical protein
LRALLLRSGRGVSRERREEREEKYSVGVRNQCQEPVGGDAVEGVVGRHCEI